MSSLFVGFTYSSVEDYLVQTMNFSEKQLTGLYATWPNDQLDLSTSRLFFDQAVGTFILTMVIFTVTDSRNAMGNLAPIVIGLSACIVGLSYGVNGGAAINPARDLGPRLYALYTFGNVAFDSFFVIPLIAPIVGAIFAAILYSIFISAHHEAKYEAVQLK